MIVLVPGVLAFVFGWFAFRSRVTGVYLSIITQALTFALLLGFFRNNFGFGGNNGLTDFKDILGFNVQAQGTRAALFAVSCIALGVGFLICRAIVTSKFGKVLIAIRDAEARTRFLGYRVGILQAVRVHAVGLHGRRRRRALRAAGRHHQSERILAGQFDRGGDLGRGRRPRHADRRGARRDPRQLRQDHLHLRRARAVLAVHARRAVRRRDAVPAARHRRHLAMVDARGGARAAAAGRTAPRRRRPRRRSRPWKPAPPRLLYLNGVTVSFDGFQALNNLSLAVEPGEMRAIIGPNGAGKTTMMDVVTGKTRPDDGDVFFDGSHDLTKLDETADRELGIGRKFQKPTVFEMHTVEDNLLLALKKRPPAARRHALARRPPTRTAASTASSTPSA